MLLLRSISERFLVRADYLRLEEHFINRYRMRINKGHLLFTEHHNFLKSIKKSSQKVKTCEHFPQILKMFENVRISSKNRLENRGKWSKIRKIIEYLFYVFLTHNRRAYHCANVKMFAGVPNSIMKQEV